MITKRILVSGRVQGVGFRRFIQKCAEELRLAGTVQNKPDGSVEIFASGNSDSLDGLLERAKLGPTFSHVSECFVEDLPVRSFESFRIKKDEEY